MLWYGLLIPPVVWAIQLELNYGLASHACFPAGTPRASFLPGWERIWVVLLVVNLVCSGYLRNRSPCLRIFLASLARRTACRGGSRRCRISFPGAAESVRRFRAPGERSVHRRHILQHPLPLGAFDMLAGLAPRALWALPLALIGSAALAQESFPPSAPGSPAHGAALIAEKGCGACHMIPASRARTDWLALR